MTVESILLKAQNDALRSCFAALLDHVFGEGSPNVWLAKYHMWDVERKSLPSLTDELPENIGTPIARRRFQLQTLLDIAWLEGGLEEALASTGLFRRVGADQKRYAAHVIDVAQGNMSEWGLVDAIDRIEGWNTPCIYDSFGTPE